MDPRIKEIIEKIRSHTKSSHPWTRGEPFPQPTYSWTNGSWQAQQPAWTQQASDYSSARSLSILSWNIDFMRTFTEERIKAALDFLQTYTQNLPNPTVIMLNEMLQSDLEIIMAQTWVRQQYAMTDLSAEFWESGYYGTCVLVSKTLPIASVFRVHYTDTAMERDGLFIDLAVNNNNKVRICCTHLESLVADLPKRPNQLAEASRFMHQADASVLGGDLNAIQPFDKTLHSDNSLKDAYLEHGGTEDAPAGMTWGQMAPAKERERFGLSRMDKLMFCGTIKLDYFETFGMDVIVHDTAVADRIMAENGLEKPWVTDHLGVRGDFTLEPTQAANS